MNAKRMSGLWTVLLKELREFSRDRRTGRSAVVTGAGRLRKALSTNAGLPSPVRNAAVRGPQETVQ